MRLVVASGMSLAFRESIPAAEMRGRWTHRKEGGKAVRAGCVDIG